jgi:hypothetical protein
MRFAACPVFPALPGELKRTGEPRRRQSGCIGTPALSGNWKPFDIAGTAKTMTAMLAFTDSQLRSVWAALPTACRSRARRLP